MLGSLPPETQMREHAFTEMGLSKHFEKVNEDFFILGQYNDSWEPYIVGKNYEAFVVKRK